MVLKIIIIKLGAAGDVVRTTPVLFALKEKYPESEITWITKPDSAPLIEGNPKINKILAIPLKAGDSFGAFDILYNFDMEKEAITLANIINADKKYGFYDNQGYPAAFNLGAEYYLNTLFDDELKKSNRKTYQQMMFEAAELPYKHQPCEIFISQEDKEYAEKFAKDNKITDFSKLIGINMGASPRWPSKAWSEEKLKEFISLAIKKRYGILLFGGPDEIQRHEKFVSEMEAKGIKIFRNNPKDSKKQFASLINLCSKMICSDTLALHLSLALKKPAIGLFFCTSPYEVEGYGLLKKLVSPMLEKFFPEKMDQFSKELVNSISAEQVLKAVESA